MILSSLKLHICKKKCIYEKRREKKPLKFIESIWIMIKIQEK